MGWGNRAKTDNCLVNIWGIGMAIKQECRVPMEERERERVRAHTGEFIQANQFKLIFQCQLAGFLGW